jgi:hypothetical protein
LRPFASGVQSQAVKSLLEYPPRQAADTLSMREAIEEAMRKMAAPQGSSN